MPFYIMKPSSADTSIPKVFGVVAANTAHIAQVRMCTTSGPADTSVRLDNGALPTEETNRSSVPSKQMGYCPVILSKQWSRGQKERGQTRQWGSFHRGDQSSVPSKEMGCCPVVLSEYAVVDQFSSFLPKPGEVVVSLQQPRVCFTYDLS